ncbi:hypothetical protein BDQ17DRAFT_1338395 [Cyathus striatus]|nr:hypothetical protein BDQ17DRAFT_1338395 [Cyathus striatus]
MSGFSLDQHVQTQIDVENEKPQFPLVPKSTTSAYRAMQISYGIINFALRHASGEEHHSTSVHNAALIGAIGGSIVSATVAGPFIYAMVYSESEKRLSLWTVNWKWSMFSWLFNLAGLELGAVVVKKMMLIDSIVIKSYDIVTVVIFLSFPVRFGVQFIGMGDVTVLAYNLGIPFELGLNMQRMLIVP